MDLSFAIKLLKQLGLNPQRPSFQASAVLLASSVGLSDSRDTATKEAALKEAIRRLKDAFKCKEAEVDPLAAMLLAGEIVRAKADADDAAKKAAFEEDNEIIHNCFPDYAAMVRGGQPADDVAVQFVAAMENLLGKELPGLINAVRGRLAQVAAEVKPEPALEPQAETGNVSEG